jgi:hypothetical protein
MHEILQVQLSLICFSGIRRSVVHHCIKEEKTPITRPKTTLDQSGERHKTHTKGVCEK